MGAKCSKEQAMREAAPFLAQLVLEGRARAEGVGAAADADRDDVRANGPGTRRGAA